MTENEVLEERWKDVRAKWRDKGREEKREMRNYGCEKVKEGHR